MLRYINAVWQTNGRKQRRNSGVWYKAKRSRLLIKMVNTKRSLNYVAFIPAKNRLSHVSQLCAYFRCRCTLEYCFFCFVYFNDVLAFMFALSIVSTLHESNNYAEEKLSKIETFYEPKFTCSRAICYTKIRQDCRPEYI